MFYRSVNMTIKLWPQASRCLSSADDLVCIKAERRGEHSSRWSRDEKSRETFMSCWEKMKARTKQVKGKKKQKEIHCSEAENKQQDAVLREKTEGCARDKFRSQSETVAYLVHGCLNNM